MGTAGLPDSTKAECGPRSSRQKFSLSARFVGLPGFGFVCAAVLGGVLIPSVLINFPDDHPLGIRVRLIKPAPLRASITYPAPLVIRVSSTRNDRIPIILLNSNPTPKEALASALKFHLASRADWTVYVEGDHDVSWQSVADVMDIIGRAGATVVLITTEPPASH